MNRVPSVSFLMTRGLDIISLSSLIEHYVKSGHVQLVLHMKGCGEEEGHIENFCRKFSCELSTLTEMRSSDVVFVSNPYLENAEYDFLVSKARIAYIPYGNSISNEQYTFTVHYGKHFHRIAWKIYTISDYYKTLYDRHGKHGNSVNIRTTPKFDHILKWNGRKHESDRFVLLWNIHFSIVPSYHDKDFRTWSAFFAYYQEICDILKKNGNIHVIARPHPLMMKESGEIFLKSIAIFKNMDNFSVEFADKTDYSEAVSFSDGYLTDLSSMFFDFAVTGKPIISLFYEYSRELNPYADGLFRQMSYVVNRHGQLADILCGLAGGDDLMRERRKRTLGNNNLFDFSRPACEIIAEDVGRALLKEGGLR